MEGRVQLSLSLSRSLVCACRVVTGDSLDLSCFGTGGLGLHAATSISHCDVATRDGDVILGEAQTAEDDVDVTSQHPSET